MIEQQSVTRSVSSFMREQANTVDIIKELDKLEELVEDSPQIGGRALWVNADRFFVCTNRIRAFLPEEMKRASRISRDSEKMLQEAQDEVHQTLESARQEAERIIEQARARAAELTATDAVRLKAEQEAARIIAEAREQATQIRRGADQYAKEVLAGLDAFLGRILGTVQRGRAKLEQQELESSVR
jgi:vacuolar-type H+-ATPase subunit H